MSSFPGFRMDSRWIRSMRGEKAPVNPFVPYGYFNEKERMADGIIHEVTTILLTNRECPYSCLMCDLWNHTTDTTVPVGAIPAQIEYALSRLPVGRHIKLYNSGSFFDPRAIPVEDFPQIASLVNHFDSVLVESHTAFIGEECLKFNKVLKPGLQVALGLETVHPGVLKRLNKQMTLDDFKNAVGFLKEDAISSRAFILLRPPFMTEEEGVEWACRSIDYAFNCGVEVCSVIPVRGGNGALDILKEEGCFSEPALESLEQVLDYGIGLKTGMVFADLWELERFSGCKHCFETRKERLNQINLTQEHMKPVECSC